MSFLQYHSMYKKLRYFSLDTFLDAHRDHEIIECSDAIHAESISAEELIERTDGNADVRYAGEESPWWDGTDRLFFTVIPLYSDGHPIPDSRFDIVVSVGE